MPPAGLPATRKAALTRSTRLLTATPCRYLSHLSSREPEIKQRASIERRASALYLALLDVPDPSTEQDQKLFIWAAQHIAAAGEDTQFHTLAAAAIRRVGGRFGTGGANTTKAMGTRYFAALDLINLARIGWMCGWNADGELLANEAVRISIRTDAAALVNVKIARARLEGDELTPAASLTGTLIQAAMHLSKASLDADRLQLSDLETEFRWVASLATRKGAKTEAGALLRAINTVPWNIPPDAPASAAAIRRGHAWSLAACGVDVSPTDLKASAVTARSAADATGATMISAAADRSRALSFMWSHRFAEALGPLRKPRNSRSTRAFANCRTRPASKSCRCCRTRLMSTGR